MKYGVYSWCEGLLGSDEQLVTSFDTESEAETYCEQLREEDLIEYGSELSDCGYYVEELE